MVRRNRYLLITGYAYGLRRMRLKLTASQAPLGASLRAAQPVICHGGALANIHKVRHRYKSHKANNVEKGPFEKKKYVKIMELPGLFKKNLALPIYRFIVNGDTEII